MLAQHWSPSTCLVLALPLLMEVGLSAPLSIANKYLEYVCFKQQPPLLGAAGVWCAVAVGLGACTLLQVLVTSIVLTCGCIVLVAVACMCWCVRRINWADTARKWCMRLLEAMRELLRRAWQLPGIPDPSGTGSRIAAKMGVADASVSCNS